MSGHRGAPRKVSDPVVDCLLDTTDRYVWPENIAQATGLKVTQVRHSLKFLAEEYEVVDILPSTGCAMLLEAGFDQYVERNRRYHPAHLWPAERDGEPPVTA